MILTILVQASAGLRESPIVDGKECDQKLTSAVKAVTPPFGAYAAHEGMPTDFKQGQQITS